MGLDEECSLFFEREGYFLREGVLTGSQVEEIRHAVESLPDIVEVRRKQAVYGVRNLLDVCPEVAALAQQSEIRRYAKAILGPSVFAVRATFFDKVPGANWSLFWHQDNVINVQERVETEGYSGWTQKAGVWQVQPPAELLSRMLAIRIHLDDCGENNGPLRVLPGSHRSGWIEDDLSDWKQKVPEVVCTVQAGGIVMMCPLTLHASAASTEVRHRRVIHIEYAAEDLPGSLNWHSRV